MTATIQRDGGSIRALALAGLLLCSCGAGAEAPPAAGGGITCRTPVGDGADFSEFVWDGELPPGGFFEVAVYDYNDGAPLGPWRRSQSLQEPRWRPRSYETGRWPDEILWRVHAFDREKELVAEGEAIAKR